jgi:hypothetical protein
MSILEQIENNDNENISIKSDTANKCSICWENMKEEHSTKCKHLFHKECIDLWLTKNNTCPLCRAILIKIKKHRINPTNAVVINIPRVNNNRNNRQNRQNRQNHINNTRSRLENIIKNNTFRLVIIFGLIFSCIYNLIIIHMANDYVTNIYKNENMHDTIGFILTYVFLILLYPFIITHPIKQHFSAFLVIAINAIIIILYTKYYKSIGPFFSILSLNLKINLVLSFILKIVFDILNIITLCLITFKFD